MSWSVFRPWQPRYFVLRNNELSWHSGPDTVSERGTGKTIPWDIGKCVLTNRPDVEMSQVGTPLFAAPASTAQIGAQPPPTADRHAARLGDGLPEDARQCVAQLGLARIRFDGTLVVQIIQRVRGNLRDLLLVELQPTVLLPCPARGLFLRHVDVGALEDANRGPCRIVEDPVLRPQIEPQFGKRLLRAQHGRAWLDTDGGRRVLVERR